MRARLACLMFLAPACVPAEQEADGKVPGDVVGTFVASGRITSDECGAELLGAENPWEFPVKLSRQGRVLYWLNGREAIVGDLGADELEFEFATRIETVLTPARGASPGCTIERLDQLKGALRREGEAARGFRAALSYTYSARFDAECVEFIGIPGGVASLPCELEYDLVAVSID